MPKRYSTTEGKREQHARRRQQIVEVHGADAKVTFFANNMAAGPCAECLAAAKILWRATEAPLGPLDGCPHPDQCVAGLLRTELTFDESVEEARRPRFKWTDLIRGRRNS